jgi:hypothetical protein
MHPADIKRIAIATLAAASLCALRPCVARAEQHIACPVSSLPLQAAEAIFVYGSLQEPWGELKDPERVERKDGSVINKYPLPNERGPVVPDKWIICYYDDRTYQAVKLPTATKECAVTSKREKIDPATKRPHYRVSDITCK